MISVHTLPHQFPRCVLLILPKGGGGAKPMDDGRKGARHAAKTGYDVINA